MPDNAYDLIIAQYRARNPLFLDFVQKLEHLIRDLVVAKDIKVHAISSRVKSEASVLDKLRRGGGAYPDITAVTDVCGIRIITYFADDVSRIAKVVEGEFDIDTQHSLDKSAALEPDRFGYASVHYVVRMLRSRLDLMEYRRFCDCVAEIQVRSILQHAWAEIEHDLGYKSKEAVPRHLARAFSRLAGLLELGDLEFQRIRDDLKEYAGQVARRIASYPASVPIDKASLDAFISSSPEVRQLDAELASFEGAQLGGVIPAGSISRDFQLVELRTIGQVEAALKRAMPRLMPFVKLVHTPCSDGLPHGNCLSWLCIMMAASSGRLQEVVDFLDRTRTGCQERRIDWAHTLIQAHKQVST
jgi:ppGpp synthetase/RelA/SpoT-type nucleotidyltranferase